MKLTELVLWVYPGHLLRTDPVFFFYIPEWLTMANMLNLHDDKSKCPHSQKK
jgi:hypothetical protein